MSYFHVKSNLTMPLKNISDCTAPFEVNINFDNQKDVKSDDATTMFNRGLCLEYSQIPCSSTSP